MKYFLQFGILIAVSFTAELFAWLIPFSVPSNIYGFLLMFLLLYFRIITPNRVKDAAGFLIEIMPVMFLPAATGLVDEWIKIKTNLFSYALIIAVSTILVMGVSGRVTQAIMHITRRQRK